MKNIRSNWATASLWGLSLAVLVCPFSYHIIPSIGLWISHKVEPAIIELGRHLASSNSGDIYSIHSDSMGLYLLLSMALLCGAALGLITIRLNRQLALSISAYLSVLLWAYLGMQLARYGLAKVLLNQFPVPSANILYTPAGMLDPDIYYWTLMGLSKPYTVFLGLTELGIALLFISARLRGVGIVATLLVLGHILAVNIGFDIDVKAYTLLLLAITLRLAIPVVLQTVKSSEQEFIRIPRLGLETGIAKSLLRFSPILLALIAFELLYPTTNTPPIKGEAARAGLESAYNISNTSQWKRLFFHNDNFLIAQDSLDQMHSFPVLIDANKKILSHPEHAFNIHYETIEESVNLRLEGYFEMEYITWELEPLAVQSSALTNHDWSWTIAKE